MKQIPWLTVTIHETDLRLGQDAVETAFSEVRSLNANGVRTDLCWSDIEPRMGRWDEDKVRWYRAYFERARQLGLGTICVMYSLPNWAKALSLIKPDEFLKRWEAYCLRVETILGDAGQVVQVWNEVNHPYYQWVPSSLVPRLLEIARGALDPKRELAVNVYDGLPWQNYMTRLLAEAGSFIDIIGIDSFPETYKLGNARSWEPLHTLLRRVNDPKDTWYGKKAALLETGFSTYIPLLKSYARQAAWIRYNFEAVSRLNDDFPSSLCILNWYKLFNDYGEGFLNIIGHFGIVSMPRKDRRASEKQPAYDSLAERFRLLRA